MSAGKIFCRGQSDPRGVLVHGLNFVGIDVKAVVADVNYEQNQRREVLAAGRR